MKGYAVNNPFQKERKILGSTIRRVRSAKNMTQEELAEKAHLNVSYLAKIENGYVNTSVRYLIKISRGLKVRANDLIEF